MAQTARTGIVQTSGTNDCEIIRDACNQQHGEIPVAHHQETTDEFGSRHRIVTATVYPVAMQRLSEFARLTPGWDTYDAQPITMTATSEAQRFLSELAARFAGRTNDAEPFFVAPLPYGGVQMEWRQTGHEIEIEIGPDGHIGYLLTTGQGDNHTFTERDNVQFAEVLDLVTRLCNGE